MLRGPMILLILLGALAAACRGGDNTTAADTPEATGSTSSARPTATPDRSLCALADLFCLNTSELESGTVLGTIDGDTIDVTIEGREERVRIFGIDTPERGDRCYAESRSALEALAGTQLRLRADLRERDRGGRLLRYVYTNDGVSIDAMMVGSGMAHAWTRDGAMRDDLVELEASARRERRGCLWGG